MTKLTLFDALLTRVKPTAAGQKKIEELLSKAISVLAVSLPLHDAQRLGRDGMRSLEIHIHSMASPDLKKLLKLWDPHRTIGRETTITEMRTFAVDLLVGQADVVPKPTARRRR